MANALFDSARDSFLNGGLNWTTPGGSGIKMCLCDHDNGTTPLPATHDFFDDLLAGTYDPIGNSGNTGRSNFPVLTTSSDGTGVADAVDQSFTSVTDASTSGNRESIVILRDNGTTDAGSALIVFIDTATGLPVTPGGGNIDVVWDAGANKIFKL